MNPDVPPVDIDETAEAYLMGGLTPEEIAAFEEHYITCRQCAERLQAMKEFLVAIRRAAAEFREQADVSVKIPALEPIVQP